MYLAVQKKRGEDGMRAIGFLSEYKGVVVGDCRGLPRQFLNFSHTHCNAHILREYENDPKQEWTEKLHNLLREMVYDRHKAERTGAPALLPKTVQAFQTRYDPILKQSARKNPLPIHQP